MPPIASRFYNNGYLRQRRLDMMCRGELGDFFKLFKELEEKNSHDLEKFFKNNQVLLQRIGKTEAWQVRELRKIGFHTASSTLSLMRRGKLQKASMTYLQAFSHFWGMSVGTLMYRDLKSDFHIQDLKR